MKRISLFILIFISASISLFSAERNHPDRDGEHSILRRLWGGFVGMASVIGSCGYDGGSGDGKRRLPLRLVLALEVAFAPFPVLESELRDGHSVRAAVEVFIPQIELEPDFESVGFRPFDVLAECADLAFSKDA